MSNIIYLSKRDISYISAMTQAQTMVDVTSDNMVKYFRDRRLRIIYTPQLKDLTRCATWLDKIVDGKSEQNLICYQDDTFLMVTSSEWGEVQDIDNIANVRMDQLNKMHYLAIPKTHALKTILDLNADHIPLLEHIKSTVLMQLQFLYKFNEEDIVLFFHYPPSAPHLHIHVKTRTSISNARCIQTNIFNCHPLDQVINNIKKESNYYQTHIIDYVKIIYQ
jgi:diadenosine tetraphosphate (Ap4A) HIT family hydrolase